MYVERWTDTLLYVKNVGENVTVDDLKQVFTEAEDVVIAKPEGRPKKDTDKKTKSVHLHTHTHTHIITSSSVVMGSVLIDVRCFFHN